MLLRGVQRSANMVQFLATEDVTLAARVGVVGSAAVHATRFHILRGVRCPRNCTGLISLTTVCFKLVCVELGRIETQTKVDIREGRSDALARRLVT